MTIHPPLGLLDQDARQSIAAAAEAVAAAPGRLYRILYVGPLQRAEPLRHAVEEAARTHGVDVSDWRPGWRGDGRPSLLLCSRDEAAQAAVDAAGCPDVQLIAWDGPAGAHPKSTGTALDAGGLALDLRVDAGPLADGARIGEALARTVTDPAGRANPLVAVAPDGMQRVLVDLARLHLEAAGVSPVELASERTGAASPAAGTGVIVQWTAPSAAPSELAALAARCRAAGSPLVLVTDALGCRQLRDDPAWVASAGDCAVVATGRTASDADLAGLPWPPLPDVWAGLPYERAEAGAETMVLPDGTSLLEALGYLEVRARPGRLLAWTTGRLAVIDADQRPAGVVVVGVEIWGRGVAGERETALAWLEEIRRWRGARMALVASTPQRHTPSAGETVQRIAFFFSRMDDERAASAGTVAEGAGARTVDVASGLVGHGLADAARALLLAEEGGPEWSPEGEILIAFLDARREPDAALERLRRATHRLAAETDPSREGSALQADATLNGVLLMVRAGHVSPGEAWAAIEQWLRQAGTAWVASLRHAAVLLELAVRAGEKAGARRCAGLFRSLAGPEEPLARTLEPVLAAVWAAP